MRAFCLGLVAVVSLAAAPAHACLELHNAQTDAQAFEAADMVVRVLALTESYLPAPGQDNLRVGVATGRITEVLKGGLKVGDTVIYRVVDGEEAIVVQNGRKPPTCPARRFTRPGRTYKLYLKGAEDRGPPLLIYPTDAYASGGGR